MGKGTGLGLAMIYGAVRQNNGFIHVYSEPGQGTTFRVYLPKHSGPENVSRKEDAGKSAAKGSETVLVVEDEPGILNMTSIMLEKLGYSVLASATPEKAIQTANTHTEKIDLLLTDVIMPEMNGKSLAEKIAEIHPGIRCLFMSGYTANVIAHHGVLDPGVHFLQKPFSIQELATKTREALE